MLSGSKRFSPRYSLRSFKDIFFSLPGLISEVFKSPLQSLLKAMAYCATSAVFFLRLYETNCSHYLGPSRPIDSLEEHLIG